MPLSKTVSYPFAILLFILLYLLQVKDFNLFHTLAEAYSIVISFFIFFIIWNFRAKSKHRFFIILAIAYLTTALADIFHLIFYNDLALKLSDITIAFWLTGRFIESFSLVLAALYIHRKLSVKPFFIFYATLFSVAVVLIFSGHFPLCYDPKTGLSAFKIYSEYLIILLFLIALYFFKKDQNISKEGFKSIYFHIALMTCAELSFTLYSQHSDFVTFLGHILKVLAYYFLYKAVVITIVNRPFGFLFMGMLGHYFNLYDQGIYLQNILNSVNSYLLVLRPNGQIINVNNKLLDRLRLKSEDLLYNKIWDTPLVGPKERERLQRLVLSKRVKEQAHVIDLEIPILEEKLFISWRLTTIICNISHEELTICSGTDVTELRHKSFHLDRSANIIENLPVMIIITDKNTLIEYVNPAFERSTGYLKEELIGQHIRILQSKKINNNYTQMWRTLEEKRIWKGIFYNKKKDGTEYTVKNTIFSLKNVQNERYYIAIQEDITSKLKIKQILYEKTQLLDTIFNSVPAMIWVKDRHNTIIQANKAAADFSLINPSEIAGKHVSEVYPIMAERYLEDNKTILQTKQPLYNITSYFYTQEGDKRWMKIDKIPIVDIKGRVTEIIVFALDITKQKELEDLLRSKEAHALKESREKTKFLSNISHELKTPMNTVLGYTQILYNEELISSTKHKTMLESVLSSGHYLMNLINELLDITRIESGNLQSNYSDFDLKEFLETLYNIFIVQIDLERITLFFEGIPDQPFFIYSDRQKLYNIISNLITNAIKFTSTGGITVLISHSKKRVKFVVQDTGSGIDAEKIETIYAPFYQTEQGKQKGGIGLGLSIVKEYVHHLKGSIAVKSEVGKGSRFTLIFPLQKGSLQRTDSRPFTILMLDEKSQELLPLKEELLELGADVLYLEKSEESKVKINDHILNHESVLFINDDAKSSDTKKNIQNFLSLNPHLNIYVFYSSLDKKRSFEQSGNIFYKRFDSSTGELFEILYLYNHDKYLKQIKTKQQKSVETMDKSLDEKTRVQLLLLAEEGDKMAFEEALETLRNHELKNYLQQLSYDFQFQKIIHYLTNSKGEKA